MLHPSLVAHAASNNTAPPIRLGSRYDADGFLPECGNTIVRHLDLSAPAHAAVLRARARLMDLAGAECLLFTPKESLHMTVFEGVIETRRTDDAWPAGQDRAAEISDITAALKPRLAAFVPPASFDVSVVDIGVNGLVLDGVTEADRALMRMWRDALTVSFGYRHAAHDDYRFHMTFAYSLGWIDDAHLADWDRAFREILSDLRAAAPVIPLRPAAFCTFDDMERFEEIVVLGDTGP